MQLKMLGEPRKNEPYSLILDDKTIEGTTDGDGFLKPLSGRTVLEASSSSTNTWRGDSHRPWPS
jgi:hypothetical protein